jgi:hypothetical protein
MTIGTVNSELPQSFRGHSVNRLSHVGVFLSKLDMSVFHLNLY